MTKYNYKEKQKHFNDLRAEQHAPADVELLEKKAPAHQSLGTYKRAPRRNSNNILYELLEVATREEIVTYRRNYKSPEQLAEEEAKKKAAEEKANLEDENNELQEQNEDLQAENEELQEQTEALHEELAEEKKKEPAKAKAKASGKKTNTRK